MTRPPFSLTERGEILLERVQSGEIGIEDYRREQEDYYDEIRAEMRRDD